MAGVLGRPSEHERVEVLLSTYLDGRTTEAERALVERHLRSCTDCTRSLTTLRATVAAVRALPQVRAPRSFALPRSTARRSQTAPWVYPLLRTATAVTTFLFALLVAGDVFLTRLASLPAAAPMYSAPAAPPSTAVALQTTAMTAEQSAQATRAEGQAESLPQPQTLPPSAAKQPAATAAAQPAPRALATATPAPQPTQKALAAAPAAAPPTSEAAASARLAATPVEAPREEPLMDGGLGGGGGPGLGGQGPGAPALPPTQAPALEPSQAMPTAILPTATPPSVAQATLAATQVARAPAPPPAAAGARETSQVSTPAINPIRIAQVALAAFALVLGLVTWIVHRRSR